MNIAITGATSGIGRQLALDYHRQGHRIWALGRSRTGLAELKQQGLHIGRVDLQDRQATLEWFSGLEALDLLILSAGTCEYMDPPGFDSALLDRVMTANLATLAHTIEAALPALRRGQNPRLVGLGSSAAYLPLPRAEAYGASKAAVAYLLKTLRITLGPQGIGVSLVCPGFVKTPLTDRNDFPMPMRINVEDASRAIRKGIEQGRAEIHFPKRFTLALKTLALLPDRWWEKLGARMVRS